MTITVSKQEFCDRVSELLTMLESGAEIVVQRPGQSELKVTAGQPPTTGEKKRGAWVFDMHPGGYIAPDFADPLPDEFWEGTI